MKKITIITLVVIFLAACSKENMDVTSGTSTQDGLVSNIQLAKTSRPFSATINAAADPNAPLTGCTGGFAAPDFLLSGTAAHLGLMNVQLSRLHHISCDLNSTTMLLTTNVTVDLVAANGDLIRCTGDDVVNVVTVSITGTWTITGGTGRFALATGSLTINGTVDFATNSFNCACVGTISY